MHKLEAIKELQILNTNLQLIVKTNEDENFRIATLLGFKEFSGQIFPWIKIEKPEKDKGKECFGMGVIIPYTPEMHECLNRLTYKKQWELLSKIKLLFNIIR